MENFEYLWWQLEALASPGSSVMVIQGSAWDKSDFDKAMQSVPEIHAVARKTYQNRAQNQESSIYTNMRDAINQGTLTIKHRTFS